MVIWVVGLSGAGKTTLCDAFRTLIKPAMPELVTLDGDVVRAAAGNDLGHTEADRIVQFARLHRLARALAEQDLVVVVAAVYSNPELLDWNRRELPGYFEVHLKASLKTVGARDTKGLYAQARSGVLSDVVGVDIPAHTPSAPDLLIDADACEPPAVLAQRLALAHPRLASAVSGATRQRLSDTIEDPRADTAAFQADRPQRRKPSRSMT